MDKHYEKSIDGLITYMKNLVRRMSSNFQVSPKTDLDCRNTTNFYLTSVTSFCDLYLSKRVHKY